MGNVWVAIRKMGWGIGWSIDGMVTGNQKGLKKLQMYLSIPINGIPRWIGNQPVLGGMRIVINMRARGVGKKWKHKLVMDLPDGLVVVVDTREKGNPLFHRSDRPMKGIPMVRKTLKYGDYSVLGFETEIVVERKKIGDLFGCLGKDRVRFNKELEGLTTFERPWILVEAELGTEDKLTPEEATLSPHDYSKMHPNAVRQSLASIEIRTGVPIHYTRNKTSAEIWVMDRFIKYYRWKREGVL
ncbi:MAG: hypothetical protein JRD69_10325 [Deltaproteobacteria bacterium]|nr:hypothetical protein [Deltaproteobacteria bacterium]